MPEPFSVNAKKRVRIRIMAARDLRPGNQLINGLIIEEVHHDDFGTWIQTSDGDMGYTDDKYRVICD